jgi:hypothetical protein
MRLLHITSEERLRCTEDFIGEKIPPHAILSHTWKEGQEVTFADLKDLGNSVDIDAQTKEGYQKLRFCAKQAKRDGLDYFWVDTCCIDKSNNTELSEAINSMFRWYQTAEKCYVYLSDVEFNTSDAGIESSRRWKPDFRKSRWFTRGWTLQELLAPASVDFFSKDGVLLGNKRTLQDTIHEITGLPIKALLGGDLLRFNIAERFSWAQHRQTAREEDSVYCLLGIFDVYLPLIYGEGKNNALKRLTREIQEASKDITHASVNSTKTRSRSQEAYVHWLDEPDPFINYARVHKRPRPASPLAPITKLSNPSCAPVSLLVSDQTSDERWHEWTPTKLRHVNKVLDSIKDFATRPDASADCQEVLRLIEDGESDNAVQADGSVLSIQKDWSGRGSHVDFGPDETVPLDKGRVLGHGINGEVLEVTCKGVRVALKRIHQSRRIPIEQMREISILRKVRHQHIVTLIGTYTQRRYLGLLLWPVAQCDLAVMLRFVERKNFGPEPSETFDGYDMDVEELAEVAGTQHCQIWSMFGCLTSAMLYLHENNIRHKDIKPSNILLSRKGIWITDFGASKDFTSDFTSTSASQERGTLKYCAPEVAKFEESGRSADIFSLGCVFLEMMIVLVHKHTLSDLESCCTVRNGSYEANLQYLDDWFALVETSEPQVQHILYEIRQMLDSDRARRPTADALDSRMTGIDLYTRSQTRRLVRGSCCGGLKLNMNTRRVDSSFRD